MNDNIKVGIGFFIPATAIILFVASLYAENFLLSAFISILGLLAWFLYSAVMQTNMPNVTGNIIILFGVLLSLSIFLSFGMKKNMFGGYEFVAEGGAGSSILLLIIVLVGILFKKSSNPSDVSRQPVSKISLDTPSMETQTKEKDSDPAEYLYQDVGEDEDSWDDEDYEEYENDWNNRDYEE